MQASASKPGFSLPSRMSESETPEDSVRLKLTTTLVLH